MTLTVPPCYSTAVYSYTPSVASNGDPQAVQAALAAVVQRIRLETERRGREAVSLASIQTANSSF
jgi:hypothetical protein